MDTLQRVYSLPEQNSRFLFEQVQHNDLERRTCEVSQAVLYNSLIHNKHPIYKLETQYGGYPEKPPFFSSQQWGTLLAVCLVSGYVFYKNKTLAALTLPLIPALYFHWVNRQTLQEYEKKKECTYGIYLTPKSRTYTLPDFQGSSKIPEPFVSLEMLKNLLAEWRGEGNFLLFFITRAKIHDTRRNLQLLIKEIHLHSQEPYLYSVHFEDVSGCARFIHKSNTLELAVYLTRSERPRPTLGTALEEDGSLIDVITQDTIPEKLWTSPQYLYFKNSVIELKDYLKHLFIEGEHTHPIYRTPLEEDEKKAIVKQITQILQIHEDTLKAALEVSLSAQEKQAILEDKNHLGITGYGEFTPRAMQKITYLLDVPNDPKAFSTLIQNQLDAIFLLLAPLALANLQECDELFNHFSQPACKRDVPAFFLAVDRIRSHLQLALGIDIHALFPVLMTREISDKQFPFIAEPSRWTHHLYIYSKMDQKYPDKAEAYKGLIRKEMFKTFSQRLLNTCGFCGEIAAEALTQKRLETFERLADISFA